jgi:hypothetical protein
MTERRVAVGFGALVAVAALLTVQLSQAATFVTTAEAEGGILQGATQKVTATGASGGQAVTFGRGGSQGNDMLGMAVGGDIQYMSAAERNARLDTLQTLGAGWLRFDLKWSDIQSGGADSYDWGRHDAVVQAANDRDIQVLLIILGTPEWARQPSCRSIGEACPAALPTTMATFAGKAVQHYLPMGVRHWEVWNEPNNVVFWKPKPDSTVYTELLKASYAAIKAADPGASVLGGSTSPATNDGTNIDPRDFMQRVYEGGGGDSFDAWAHHPYCYAGTFDCPKTQAPWSAWSQMSLTQPNLRGIMSANGDAGKKIWLTEFGAPTGGDGTAVSEARQDQMLRDSYGMVRDTPWLGPLMWYSLKDRGTSGDREDWFGLIRANGSFKPAFNTYKQLAGN